MATDIEQWVRIGEALKRAYPLGKIIKVDIKQHKYTTPKEVISMDTKDSLTDELADALTGLEAALKWWDKEAQYLSVWRGGDEHNIFDGDPEWVVEARKILAEDKLNGVVDCEFFEVIDWDEDTNEIIHAMCTIPSPCWPNCNSCLSKVEYADTAAEIQEADMLGTYKPTTLMHSAAASLWQSDVDVLNANVNRKVRIAISEDVEVKRLYHIWKSL